MNNLKSKAKKSTLDLDSTVARTKEKLKDFREASEICEVARRLAMINDSYTKRIRDLESRLKKSETLN